ncbi:MAG: peptidylprolyl isomerase [Bacteroidetes bacterium SB0662_bin_6]|nr:peptidylprolyl isomerase [Bacteroidetes bacterium SB0668_bin_1]MYE04595.1 peptidylprolyl isomerase [Bacteroidetes bacterium SB0662_bin_6]
MSHPVITIPSMNTSVQSFIRSFSAPVRAGTALCLLLLLAACGSDEETSEQTDDVQYAMGEPLSDASLAVVVTSEFGADTLSTQTFEEQVLFAATQFGILGNAEETRRLRKSLVEEFVLLEHLVFGEADRLGLTATDESVEERMRQIVAQFPDEETFRQALAGDNLTEEGLREQIGNDITQRAMLDHFAANAEEPEPDEIVAFSESRAEEVRASHILFIPPPSATAEQKDSTLNRAVAVLDSIRTGADFAEMAQRHSQGPSGPGGGDLGFFSRGDMVEPFEQATYALRDSGDVTQEPIETSFGYHLIKLTGRRTATLMDSSEARQMILRERQRDAVQNEIDRLRASVTVHVNPDVVDVDLNAPEE